MDDLHVDVPVQLLVRERDSVVAGWPVPAEPVPNPDERVPPPRRVLDTMRLSSADVVLDVAPPTPRRGHASGGMAEILAAADERGQALFGRSWPAARMALLAELDLARLRQDLRTMMAGQPIVVKVPHGQVLITARVLEIEHASSTEQTEFNSGTQRRTAVILSERDTGGLRVAADRDGGTATVATGSVLATTDPVGGSPIAVVAGVTGTLSMGNQTARVRSLAGTVAITTKAKEAGEVFVGSMLLNVRLERNTSAGPPQVAMAFAPARFTALIRGSEVGPVPLPGQVSQAGPVPLPGQVSRGEWEPPARVWSPRPGEGLRDTDVVHGLPDTGGFLQAVEADGRSLFGTGTWKRISGTVFDTLGNVQLAAHLPSMTRGEALVSPPLLTGPTDPQADVTVTAQIVELRFVREDDSAELNPVSETRDRETYGRRHWWGGGAQAQAGVAAHLPGLSIVATLNAGFQRRGRDAVGETLTGRVVDNGKFAEPVARFEGHVKFTTTLRKGDQTRTFVGLAPVELSIPVNDCVAAAPQSPAEAVAS